MMKETTVNNRMLESGVKFTMMTKVSPEWNRAGNTLLQGVDFLSDVLRKKYKRVGEFFTEKKGLFDTVMSR